MYKVEIHRFYSKSTDSFTQGHTYYLRNSKDGMKKFLSTDSPDVEWQIANGGISLAASYNTSYLNDNFKHIGYIVFKNYRDFKEYIKPKKNKTNLLLSATDKDFRRLNEKSKEVRGLSNLVLSDKDMVNIRRGFIKETIEENEGVLKALVEVEKIESGELPRKSAREFLEESREANNTNS